MSDKIKVAVRVRPFNRRELELATENVIEMDGSQTILKYPATLDKMERKPPKLFAFDHCFYSTDPDAEHFASQQVVFDNMGRDILDNAFQGYNACIFAYGQTGSGKSYTMMGNQESKGIIPRLCDELFASIAAKQTDELTYKVEVSYMEIYNEKVHDLLDPKTSKQSLKVREHNVLGPYVDGLSQLAVTAFMDIDNLMAEGNKSRTVAATNMNSESSRSHAVFTVVLTQTLIDTLSGVTGEKVSRVSLVDLAGSERAVKTGAVGERLKEGSNINKSLTTLGLVISKLADQTSGSKNKDKFVPYRDSVLTWLLKDNLGGNSKTVMLATLSPAADNYEETLSTLRYADRAKRIVNHAVVNEDPNARIIRELRKEVETLREMLKHATGASIGDMKRVDIHDKLAESENLMKQISQTWEEKLEKTEQIQSERQQALEKMGISVQDSGIKVEKNKYYLVNLNADPSLNELLVYYLKDYTLIGGRNNDTNKQPDIQLLGLGIQPEHCLITIEDGELFMEPIESARCCVNGSVVTEKTSLNHGDRILWGNHHFFRVNCPKSSNSNNNMPSEPQTPAQHMDYYYAQEELMQNEFSNNPIQAAISRLEKQHEEDKQVALEKQRMEYEKQFQQLRNILSPTTPYAPYSPYDPFRLGKLPPNTPNAQLRVEKWAQERDEMFKRSLGQLKTDIVRANALVQEANVLAEEMNKQTKFSVTLQIPPANLSPNRKRGAFVSEPAILVRRMISGSQIWSMEKLENKLIDMRDMYQEYKENNYTVMDENKNKSDPFYESQENHNLIGVANIFLEVLLHDVKLDYHTPIISQQGEVAGRLQLEISRVAGQFPQDRINESASESSHDSHEDDDLCEPSSNQVTCRISIKQASGLPLYLSNFVFCQYSFWNHDVSVVPATNQEVAAHNQNSTFKFDHDADYVVTVNEEFLEHCTDGALSIEVWGHRSVGFSRAKDWEVEQQQAKARSLADRWAELSRKIELWVEIHELNDNGDWAPVDVQCSKDMLTGGVYQLRQGFQRRVMVRVKPVQNSGTLPIICQSIINVSVGCVTVRSKLQKQMDSYQEEDLTVLRDKWSEALGRRRQYLDQQIQKLINKDDKTEQEKEREQSLVNQWVSLTEERNAVLVPAPGSGIPGAPASWDPPHGMEPHVPVLFLDLNADDLTTQSVNDEVPIAGLNSILPKEHGNKFYSLQMIQHLDKDICAICSWDSSIHDSPSLNRMTEANERVYLILKTTVRLSHPAPMDLVLRKRLALNIYKRQSFTDRLKKLRLGRMEASSLQSGVTYEVVSNIPKASEELEDRESLAQIAATGEDVSASDGETYIEKYTKGVSAVESILTLDRLRQSVAIKELEQVRGPALSMRKTASVPNFSQVVKDTREHSGLTTSMTMRFFDASLESLLGIGRSESYADLKVGLSGVQSNRETTTNRPKLKSPNSTEDSMNTSYGLTRPTFLNLNINLNSLRLQPTKPSPAASKLAPRMTTLHEEPLIKQICYEEEGEDRFSDPEYSDDEFYEPSKSTTLPKLKSSHTVGSFIDIDKRSSMDLGGKYGVPSAKTGKPVTTSSGGIGKGAAVGTPSMSSSTSSGYGSQAVSCSNLTNDDTYSIRSLSVGETPESMSPSNLRNEHTMPNAVKSSADYYTPVESFNASGISTEFPKRINPFLKDMASFDEMNGNRGLLDHEEIIFNNNQKRASEPAILSHSTDMIDEEDEGLDDKEDVEQREFSNQEEGQLNQAVSTVDDVDHDDVVDEENNSSRLLQESDIMENSFSTPSKHENIPEWVVVGESVQIRPYNTSGMIAFIGGTHFQGGTWIGIELDTPTGKNDGTVQGIQYFSCKPKHGIFVRVDKLILDKRGRAIRELKRAEKMKAELAGQKAKPVSMNGPRK
ncbi:kinesin-like protein KIF13A isoform X1 [Topomyia yanbarensis]|uniref:kinesin-like protein KIF13A isoform X1 n=1 Tax=Topomyia yanbarensis TaxID=2498891 RepID=UPI00273C1938|nr:kinesin-like protein KIF13A isoform X1 [Topomyia yanbarensis]XP_058836739.1 kinesin-like protein KIF13A isoform X1 [Topomyia yanbarensis]XP_058836740.1 kinesin-like protein KIF13A isoform X1 [Topomyia yanbarensis]XP_058836741.1 kinesin-like protein KIF13A isoform X1 [Topomyia yanbarensis]XP_058836742.1 kinesin-like protein KIF13A isoform X1 [Topomyia yanbarensis]